MLKETAILRPALWAPKYLGGRILFRLRFRLKTFGFLEEKVRGQKFFFVQSAWLGSNLAMLWRFTFKGRQTFSIFIWKLGHPNRRLSYIIGDAGYNDHIDIIHYKLDENEFCKSACSSVFSQNVVQWWSKYLYLKIATQHSPEPMLLSVVG